jgi:hypothetical protein
VLYPLSIESAAGASVGRVAVAGADLGRGGVAGTHWRRAADPAGPAGVKVAEALLPEPVSGAPERALAMLGRPDRYPLLADLLVTAARYRAAHRVALSAPVAAAKAQLVVLDGVQDGAGHGHTRAVRSEAVADSEPAMLADAVRAQRRIADLRTAYHPGAGAAVATARLRSAAAAGRTGDEPLRHAVRLTVALFLG